MEAQDSLFVISCFQPFPRNADVEFHERAEFRDGKRVPMRLMSAR